MQARFQAVCVLALLAGRDPAAGDSPEPANPAVKLAVIVNRANTVEELTLAGLREVFLGHRTHWPNGRRITLLAREPGGADREAALRLIYRMKEGAFARHFLQAVYTGEALSPPKVLSSSEGMRRFVFYVPGAIGYVRAEDVDDSVRVLRVDGHAPADAGYALTTPRSP